MRASADQNARDTALDPQRSFIVQAPAGSGKTELLTRRLLSLLARAAEPEEVLAITFTRKAAAEMRHRVLAALDLAEAPAPTDEHQRALWSLARDVLTRDTELGWSLRAAPRRLRVQTIDSLCASLTRRAPLLARLPGPPATSEDVGELYRAAARRTIEALEGGPNRPIVSAIEHLFAHLGGDVGGLEELLVAQLARRDQWMSALLAEDGGPPPRDELEGALARVVEDHLGALVRATPPFLRDQLPALARGAAEALQRVGVDHPIARLHDLTALPSGRRDDLSRWTEIAALLLSEKGELRKSRGINKSIGFSAKSVAKAKMQALLEALGGARPFLELLASVRRLPFPRFEDAQWRALEALVVALKHAVAELKLLFANHGVVDFVEIAEAAHRALGADEAPSELALTLDRRIRHILVDEYQDTSFHQLSLLQRLIAGWERGDGRTLFLVGDPMQSIYRFRQAEVGLFLRAWQRGVGAVSMERLELVENFRSRRGVVDWVNEAFSQVLPPENDIEAGAVSYSTTRAFDERSGGLVAVHPAVGEDRDAEGDAIATLIAGELRRHRERPRQVAVLARAREHLEHVAAALERRAISFRAIDARPLATSSVVSDLMTLTRALYDLSDRLAWLALLRSPLCGLVLPDLLTIANLAAKTTLWEALGDVTLDRDLSPYGRDAVARLRHVIAPALAQRRRARALAWIERVWRDLGGEAAYATRRGEAATFFRLVERYTRGHALVDVAALDRATRAIFAPASAGEDAHVQLMTMHKAKGLEFDVVILPSLGRRARHEGPALVYALERPLDHGERSLLVAPIRSAREEEEPIYDYLRRRDAEKAHHEAVRLLYVAATRAKQELHLFGHADLGEDEEAKAPAASLLSHLWPVVHEHYDVLAASKGSSAAPAPLAQASSTPRQLKRLAAEAPKLAAGAITTYTPATALAPAIASRAPLKFEWASHVATATGAIVHRFLERFGRDGLAHWSHQRLDATHASIEAFLRSQGLSADDLALARRRALDALHHVLDDPRAQWILDSAHEDAHCELALSARLDGELINVVVDRTFVYKDERWIIDYKTGSHEGGQLDVFLEAEQARYRAQLARYAHVFSLIEERKIKLALYFPVFGGWVTWDR